MSTGGSRRMVTLAGMALAAAVLVVQPGTAVAAPRTYTIIIDKMKFGPVPKNVRAGDVILWVNRDIFRHTATARGRSFNIDLAPSARGKTVVKRRGTFAFYCTYHPGMTGRIVVAGKCVENFNDRTQRSIALSVIIGIFASARWSFRHCDEAKPTWQSNMCGSGRPKEASPDLARRNSAAP